MGGCCTDTGGGSVAAVVWGERETGEWTATAAAPAPADTHSHASFPYPPSLLLPTAGGATANHAEHRWRTYDRRQSSTSNGFSSQRQTKWRTLPQQQVSNRPRRHGWRGEEAQVVRLSHRSVERGNDIINEPTKVKQAYLRTATCATRQLFWATFATFANAYGSNCNSSVKDDLTAFFLLQQ